MQLKMILRMLAALALMAVLFFCVFGFLASNEYADLPRRLPWQIAYGAMGLACTVGSFRLLRRPGGQALDPATQAPTEEKGGWGISKHTQS